MNVLVRRSRVIVFGTFFLLTVVLASQSMAADDSRLCANESGDVAIAACTRAIESGKYKGHSLAGIYNNRGVELKLKRDFNRALADFSDSIRHDKNYADAYYGRCGVYYEMNDYDRAIADCTKSIKLGPARDAIDSSSGQHLGSKRTLADYFVRRGNAYQGKQNYDTAIADYTEAIRIVHKYALAFKRRALAKEKKGDKVGAAADMASAKKINPDIGQ